MPNRLDKTDVVYRINSCNYASGFDGGLGGLLKGSFGLLKGWLPKPNRASAADGPKYLALPKPKIGQKIKPNKTRPTVKPSSLP